MGQHPLKGCARWILLPLGSSVSGGVSVVVGSLLTNSSVTFSAFVSQTLMGGASGIAFSASKKLWLAMVVGPLLALSGNILHRWYLHHPGPTLLQVALLVLKTPFITSLAALLTIPVMLLHAARIWRGPSWRVKAVILYVLCGASIGVTVCLMADVSLLSISILSMCLVQTLGSGLSLEVSLFYSKQPEFSSGTP